MEIDEINEILAHKGELNSDQASFAMEEILHGRLSDQQLGLFITLLHDKGETAIELASLVRTMWKNCPNVEGVDVSQALDTCGTGGDKSGTFNISTAVSIVLAGSGIRIAKHGNRAASSKCGAADVLEALGIPISYSADASAELFNRTGFTFLFAPTFHPGMRFAAPVRKALGVPTTFNFLGPLANPYHAPYRMHGVSQSKILKTYIQTLNELEVKRAYVFHGHGSIDEISLSGPTEGFLLSNGEIIEKNIDPQAIGFSAVPLSALAGSDADSNASIITSIFDGKLSAHRDIVVLNAAVGYDLVKECGLDKAVEIVSEAIDSGKVRSKLAEIAKVSNELVNS